MFPRIRAWLAKVFGAKPASVERPPLGSGYRPVKMEDASAPTSVPEQSSSIKPPPTR